MQELNYQLEEAQSMRKEVAKKESDATVTITDEEAVRLKGTIER